MRVWVVATMFLLAAVAASAQGAKVDITGKWVFEVQTDAGTGTPTVTFKQDGEKVTGHYSSATLGEADLTGSIKGQNLTFTFNAEVPGAGSLPVTYVAKVESRESMKGSIDIGGAATGTFTGKRQ